MTTKEKILECLEAADLAFAKGGELFNDWEIDFLDNVVRLDQLTGRQTDMLEKLYGRACESKF